MPESPPSSLHEDRKEKSNVILLPQNAPAIISTGYF